MFIAFFDSKGITHREFVSTGEKITGAYYLEVLKRLIARIRCIRTEYCDPDTWFLLHDNAPSHTSLIVRQVLARNKVCVLNQPLYSPDLAPHDFSLFSKLKLKLKGYFFNDKLISTAAFKLSQSISEILLYQADSSYDSEKSFDESLLESHWNRFYID